MTRKAPPRQVPVRGISASKSAPKKSASKSPAPKKGPSLRERRERARSRFGMAMLILAGLALGAVVYGLWRPEVRVQEVRAEEVPDAELASVTVKEVLSGTYFGILPRDSIFFYPEEEAHAKVLEVFPSLESITISRDSFSALSIEGKRRTTAFFWCGETGSAFSVESASCYEVDQQGFVFDVLSGSTTMAHNPSMLRIYAPLENTEVSSYPVRAVVTGAVHLPNVLLFVTAIKELGVPVLATLIEGDEAELFVTPETRLKFVLGEEAEAIKNAKAGFEDLNLLNGSIEYVDLRFADKLYVKRYSEE